MGSQILGVVYSISDVLSWRARWLSVETFIDASYFHIVRVNAFDNLPINFHLKANY